MITWSSNPLFGGTSGTMMDYHGHTKGHTSHIRLLCEAYSLCLGLAEGKAHSFYSFNKAKIWSKIFPVGDPTVVLKRFSNDEKKKKN